MSSENNTHTTGQKINVLELDIEKFYLLQIRK